MNFDQYFKLRADLMIRVLIEVPAAPSPKDDWRFFGAGLLTLAVAIGTELWVATTQVDPGFFALTSAFLKLVLFAGIGLLMTALITEFALDRHLITSRETLKQKTLAQLLDVDGAVATKLAERGGR